MRVNKLLWSVQDLQQGKQIKIRGFPSGKKVKLFRVTVSTNRTEFVATNDDSRSSTDAVQNVCGKLMDIQITILKIVQHNL